MGRLIAVFGVFLAVTGAAVGGWVVARPRLALFLSTGAREVEMTALSWNHWQISYQAPGSPTTWYTDVAHQLEANDWSSLDRVEYGSLSRTYSRAVSFGVFELWEWAHLTFDPLQPRVAQITVRRWVAVPWWRRLTEEIMTRSRAQPIEDHKLALCPCRSGDEAGDYEM
jgi:hypothetical protein